jgi:hypothetical protein
MLKRLLHSVLAIRPDTRLAPPPAAAKRPVAFITRAAEAAWVDPEGRYDAKLASMRLRVIAPARALARHAPVVLVPLERALRDPSLSEYGSPGTIVIGKLATADVVRCADQLTALTEWLQARPADVRVFADLSDNYAAYGGETGHPFPAEYQRRLGAACPFIVPCAGLAEELAPWAGHGVHVVEDAWESPRTNAPQFAPGARLRLLWFGNAGVMTFGHLRAALAELVQGLADLPLHFTMVAAEQRAELASELAEVLRRAHADLEFRFVPWSLEATWQAIDECDVVALPRDTEGSWSRGKSHNRLVEAIRGGRFAVASPIASYRELDAYAWVDGDLAGGVRWALANPSQAEARIRGGQAAIAARFSPEAVGARWKALLLDGPTAASPARS